MSIAANGCGLQRHIEINADLIHQWPGRFSHRRAFGGKIKRFGVFDETVGFRQRKCAQIVNKTRQSLNMDDEVANGLLVEGKDIIRDAVQTAPQDREWGAQARGPLPSC